MKIRAHPSLCQGHGECHRFAPEIYHLDADGHIDVHRVEVPPELELRVDMGAACCPHQAITVIRT